MLSEFEEGFYRMPKKIIEWALRKKRVNEICRGCDAAVCWGENNSKIKNRLSEALEAGVGLC